ncbi:MAG: type II secretion system ATPase GspE [candidate division KSB1 bacterium]|nr:type II secretion system ATPase GspE [candidate division KSB1 bacterium]
MTDYVLKTSSQRLLDALVERGLLTAKQAENVLSEQRASGEPLYKVLERMGYVAPEAVLRTTAEILEVPFVSLADYNVDPEALQSLSPELAHELKVLPLFRIGDVLTVAMTDPGDIAVIDRIHAHTGLEVEPAIATEEDILNAIETYYGIPKAFDSSLDKVLQEIVREQPEEQPSATEELKAKAEEAPVIKLVNLIIAQAIRDRASDIHIEPEERHLRVRYRIDGILHEAFQPPKHLQAAITSRIKILAQMDIAETRVPQDGRFQVRIDNREVDIRVSTLPTVHGENVVLRILDKSNLFLGLDDLGFLPDTLAKVKQMLESAYGIILVTGPTGSGKTTTLYSALQSINSIEKNIITIEDPVEYRLPLIRQAQVNPKTGLTFAAGLRSILRQDPDVVMVGEIRDSETASIAVQAALTGHLVLSTLHTNDAPGAITRLTEMGVEPFLTASATLGVIAQRLVRKICPHCRVAYQPSRAVLEGLGIKAGQRPITLYRGEGCQHCKRTGYKGRIGIHEVMVMNDELRELVLKRVSSDVLRKAAIRNKMRTLRQDGLIKALRGITTVEEVVRVTNLE